MGKSRYQSILVMGAGAVGGYFGGRIAERTGHTVSLIARGEHLRRIQQRGLEIQSSDGDSLVRVPAYDDPAEAGVPDLILFTVKSYDTAEAIKQIAPVTGPDTRILTIQNGIENYPALVRQFGEHRVIQGFCMIGAGVTEPGVIVHESLGTIVAGETDGRVTERIKDLKKLFDEAKIEVELSEDIRREVWIKFAWNCIFNMLTAVAMVRVDALFKQKETEALCYKLFEEIREVAQCEGVGLTDRDAEKIIESSKTLSDFKTSTYRDRQKGKRLEYEAFTGAVVRLADEHKLKVPYHNTLYALLKLVDNQ